MKSFLEYVAEDILQKHGDDLTNIAIVFPNKRASLFLNQHLARLAGHPIWAPHYITISELFRSQSERTVADQIYSICTLFKAYCQHLQTEQTIDHFWSWGEIMLTDFDDLDKNMGQAKQVFQNIKDIHELDSIDYLTKDQRILLKQFFETFTDDHDSVLKQKFLGLWSHLEDIYHTFNQMLSKQGLAYEGALYREVAEKEELNLPYKKYIFIGFNVLQAVEQRLFMRLKRELLAEFYWDFDEHYMNDEGNEAGKYIRQYLADFPNELDSYNQEIYSNLKRQKNITYVSASTEDIQARYITDWLREGNRLKDGERTAIVLADESLLKTAIHCLPKEAKNLNITIGYPLQQSPVVALVKAFIQLHTNMANTDGVAFTKHNVRTMLRHPYAYFFTEKAKELLDKIEEEKIFYPTPEQLCQGDTLRIIFTPIVGDDFERVATVIGRLVELLQAVGIKSRDVDDAFIQESVFRMFTICNRLKALVDEGTLYVEISTLLKLIDQIAQTTTMPFHGEPAVGLQIMGVLETRNIDFDHVLMLSAGEGNIPKGVNDTSLIPHSIRKAYGLTTVENKIAIYAYYFYRLMQRADDITLTYNNSTEDGHTGQMSRFMVQLMVEASWLKIKHKTLIAKQEPERGGMADIAKDEDTMATMNNIKALSPSALNKYLRCPVSFYYYKVKGLQQVEDEDVMDGRIFGNVFHKAAELMYKEIMTSDGLIRPESIDILLGKGNEKKQRKLRYHKIYEYVDKAFVEEFFRFKDNTRKPQFDGLQLINREVIVKYLIRLLEADRKLAPFTILGLEQEIGFNEVKFHVEDDERSIGIHGIIDRLDKITEGTGQRIRVVDYKTGHKEPKVMNSVEEIFDPGNIKGHSDYYLQTMLYSSLIRNKHKLNKANLPVSPSLLFIQHSTNTTECELAIGKERVLDIEDYREEFIDKIKELLGEIFNPNVAFSPTPYRERCQTCEFWQMCKNNRD